MKEIPILFERKALCCGCTACVSICPKNAIELCQDKEGFLYPFIDKSKCVGCYQCVSVCPIKKDIDPNLRM